jgi:hypothetical protein
MDMSKVIAWLELVVVLTAPLAAVLLAPFIDGCRRVAAWNSVIHALLVVPGLFLLTAPLLIESTQRRTARSLPRSAVDLAPHLLFLTGAAGSSAVSFIGLVSVCFGNSSALEVYGWVAISVAGVLFYSRRYRRALI